MIMGNRGPKPDSDMDKWLKGKANKRPANGANMAVKASERPKRPPKPPDNLGEHGIRAWRFLWRRLVEMDLLAASDMVSLEMMCATYQVWYEASLAVKKHGVLIDGANGRLVKNPALQIMRDSDTAFHRWARAFGLAPTYAMQLGLIDDD